MTKNTTDDRPLADLLQTHRIFGLLSVGTQKTLADTLTVRHVSAGTEVCTDAELQDQLFWLVSGRFALLGAHQQTVLTLNPGEVFGLQPDGAAGIERSQALTDCRLVSLDGALVATLKAELPALHMLLPGGVAGPASEPNPKRAASGGSDPALEPH